MPTRTSKKNKGGQRSRPVRTKPVKTPEPDSDSSVQASEEEVPVKVVKKSPAKPVKPVPAMDLGSDDDDDDNDNSDENDDSNENDDSDQNDSEGETPKPRKANNKAAKKTPKKETFPKKTVKRPAPADDDAEEDEESEDEESEKEEEEVPAKKQKLGGEVVSLFVGQLNFETTDEALKKFFKKNGITVKEVRKPEKKRFRYVDVDASSMDAAIALSGVDFEGKNVIIELAKPKTDRKATPTDRQHPWDRPDDGKTLFVKGLADSVDESMLQEFFSEATSVNLPHKDGCHKGFAFVKFADAATAEKVMGDKQGADLEGNSLYLDYTGSKSSFKAKDCYSGDKPTGERGSTCVLFVKNLSFNTDESSLKGAFSNALAARIARFPDSQKPKGFGFVEFSSPEDAVSAYDQMLNKEIEGRQVYLDFASSGGGGGRLGGFRGRGGHGGFRGQEGRGGLDRGGRGVSRGGSRGGRGGGVRGGLGEKKNRKIKFDSDSD